MEWEQIDGYHKRAKVFGGWLVKAFEYVSPDDYRVGNDWRVAMTFVPDPNYEWKIE